jgi:trans-aconitate methyltransferase
MLFYRESYREDAFEGWVDSFEDWLVISKSDYKTPQQRFVKQNGAEIEVNIPLVPGRARTKNGYEREMTESGFIVDQIQLMNPSNQILNSATVYVHKPKTEPYKGIAAEYDKTRPSYPDELVRDVISKTNLSVNSAILEIGAGTGKATVQFAEKGFAIHAIELGPEMAEICKNKCMLYPKVTIDIASFEEWKNKNDTKYNLIFSAQTFHWLESDVKYKKCHELLNDGGYLALFWYIAHNERSGTIREIEQHVNRIMQEYKADKANGGEVSVRPQHKSSVDDAAIRSEIETSGLFRLMDRLEYSAEIRNTAEEYFMSRKSTPAFSSSIDILDKDDIFKMDSEIINLAKDCKEEVITKFRFSLYIAQKIDKMKK